MDTEKITFSSFSLEALKNGRPSTCSLGSPNIYMCLISADGNVVPCTPALSLNIQNNILEKGFKKSWEDIRFFKDFLKLPKL